MTVKCEKCETWYSIGDSPFCRDKHEKVEPYHPFRPYFDIALGKEVTSIADRRNSMKELHAEFKSPKVGMPGCEV